MPKVIAELVQEYQMSEIQGGCLCGSVRFTCKSAPIASYACHCRFCQRSLGTAYRAAMSFNLDDVQFNDGELRTYTYKSYEHGRELYIHFCPTCSTQVTATTERFPDRRVMMIGTLDDPSQIDVSTHMFADESFHWVSAHDDDVVYAKHRMNEDGTPAKPL
jgi:hypothetical protein